MGIRKNGFGVKTGWFVEFIKEKGDRFICFKKPLLGAQESALKSTHWLGLTAM
jgi:hypothetical protein